ncbi:MAG: ABC transporter permease [Thermoproteota archaeon]|nr:ABC transporter permease [Candidatus Brockarchaeota archaeon]MBO3768759.1 ABC transporter permease [Candidatus Brockarchaeota archaeon]
MKLYEYVIRRLFMLVPVVLGVTIMTFYLSRVVLDPLAAYVTEKTPAYLIPVIRHQLGLDQPFYVQYLYYLRDLITLNWGWSRAGHMSVADAIATFFPATVELTTVSIIITLLVGIPLGIISALRNNKIEDHASRVFSLIGISMPVFWLGLSLQYLFTYWTRVQGWFALPSTGRYDPILFASHPVQRITGLLILDSLIQGNFVMAVDAFSHIILPAITLAFLNIGVVTRLTRSSMLEVLRQDYITFAKSYGLPQRIVIYKYALRNAMIPVVTSTGLMIGGLLGGAIMTESIFAFPGMGWLSYRAIIFNDSNTIMAYVVLSAFVFVLVNLLVDLIYAWLDPRIKY